MWRWQAQKHSACVRVFPCPTLISFLRSLEAVCGGHGDPAAFRRSCTLCSFQAHLQISEHFTHTPGPLYSLPEREGVEEGGGTWLGSAERAASVAAADEAAGDMCEAMAASADEGCGDVGEVDKGQALDVEGMWRAVTGSEVYSCEAELPLLPQVSNLAVSISDGDREVSSRCWTDHSPGL